MGRRLRNPRLAKRHRSYTVEEVARLYCVHRGTVREWIKRGLMTCDDHRPMLILGSDLRKFLEQKRTANKRRCGPGEIYCVRCRQPRKPAGGMVDYLSTTRTTGSLVGLCPVCEKLMYRCTSTAKMEQMRGHLDIRTPKAHSRIATTDGPLVNTDFR